MSTTRATSGSESTGPAVRRWRLRLPSWRRRSWLIAAGVALAIAGVAVALANPFAGAGSGGVPQSGAATSLATVERRSLSSQTLVDGTLLYAGSSSIIVPTGTSQTELRTARQAVDSAEAAVRVAEQTLTADQRALAQARAKLAADRLKQSVDCRGDNAAGGSGNGGNGEEGSSGAGSGGGGSSPCSAAAQAVASDEQAVSTAEQKVTADEGAVATARATLEAANESLAAAESSATGYEMTAAYTMLPAAGRVIRRGQALYAVAGGPVLLLYGRATAWRAFRPGMPSGQDVAQLNANLSALGYGRPAGAKFSAATENGIRALQAEHGRAPTGVLPLGSVVFKPGPVRVKGVTPKLGEAVQAGEVLSVTTNRHQVAIELDAAHQAEVALGDPVVVTLPSGQTTPGRVSFVGSVATTPEGGNSEGGGGAGGTPTIDVGVRLLRQAAAGRLDQAPVSVAITTASVDDVLVVPVNALLALAGGGYAVEVVSPAGVHRLEPVTLGLFDDGQGLVEVSGSGLRAGQRVVVPVS